jgi:hypothetical protein
LPSDEEPTAPCPRCGRPPVVLHVVADPNFYGNAEQLEEAKLKRPRARQQEH